MQTVQATQRTATRIKRGYLEYFLADHCNLRCAQCSHYSPYLRPWTPPLEEFQRDLEALAAVMQVGRFRFLGGEPLLNRQLPQFIATVRASGFTRQVGLCTNGVLLHKADPETLRSLDWLDVSLYEDTTPDRHSIAVTARELCDRLGVRLNLIDKPEFRYQNLDRPIEDPETVKAIYDSCMMAHGGFDLFHDGCHTIYQGWYYRCNRPAYTRRYLDRQRSAAQEVPDFQRLDGVPLHEPGLKDRLTTYLLCDTPLEACRWCLGTSGIRQANRMLTIDEVRRRVPTEVTLEDVIDRAAMAASLEAVRPARSRTRRQLSAKVAGA